MSDKNNRFASSMFGYHKKTVDEKIDDLEGEITYLKNQVEQIKRESEEKIRMLKDEAVRVEESKKRIAEAYLEAQKNADNLLEQAKNEIAIERHMYEVENEMLKDIIVERKEAIRNIRLSVQSFGSELESYFDRVLKNLSSDIQTAVKQLDYEHLEKISADPELHTEEQLQQGETSPEEPQDIPQQQTETGAVQIPDLSAITEAMKAIMETPSEQGQSSVSFQGEEENLASRESLIKEIGSLEEAIQKMVDLGIASPQSVSFDEIAEAAEETSRNPDMPEEIPPEQVLSNSAEPDTAVPGIADQSDIVEDAVEQDLVHQDKIPGDVLETPPEDLSAAFKKQMEPDETAVTPDLGTEVPAVTAELESAIYAASNLGTEDFVVSNPEAETPVVSNPEAGTPAVSNAEAETPVVPNLEAEPPVVLYPEAETPVVPNPEAETPVVPNPEEEPTVVSYPEAETHAVPYPERETPVILASETEPFVTADPDLKLSAVPEMESQSAVNTEAMSETAVHSEAESQQSVSAAQTFSEEAIQESVLQAANILKDFSGLKLDQQFEEQLKEQLLAHFKEQMQSEMKREEVQKEGDQHVGNT